MNYWFIHNFIDSRGQLHFKVVQRLSVHPEYDLFPRIFHEEESHTQLPEEEGFKDDDGEDDDTPANMEFIERREILSEGDGNHGIILPAHNRCAAHTMNLIVTSDFDKALTNSKVKKVARTTLAKCRAIWNKQQRSVVAADLIQEKLGMRLVFPCPTRWSSMYHALVRVLFVCKSKRNEFNAIFDKLKISRLAEEEIGFIKDFITIMKPINDALDILQGEKNAFMGIFIPTLLACLKELKSTERKISNDFIDLSAGLRQAINCRFDYALSNEDFLIASALHPGFKLAWIDDQSKKK